MKKPELHLSCEMPDTQLYSHFLHTEHCGEAKDRLGCAGVGVDEQK